MYVNPDGSVLPCCVADYSKHMGNVRQDDIKTIWNNDKYRSMRQKMLRGEKCEECNGCYAVESAGNQSTRQSTNDQYSRLMYLVEGKTNNDGSLDEMHLRHFDVRWSNICNFKCRSCSSTYSSTWAQEDNLHGANKPVHIIAGGNNNDELYKQFLPYFADMETFYFAGGEPLLTDKHYDILEHLISVGNTDRHVLKYNTNISNLKYKNKNVIDLWNQFPFILLFLSIDSFGKRAEYIRTGTDWNVIKENIKKIRKECPHIKIETTNVISVFNVYTIPDYLDYMFENDLFDKDTYNPSFYNIINPGFYSFQILPESFKRHTITKLRDCSIKYNKKIQNQISSVIRNLEAAEYSEELHQKFCEKTEYYDSIRNTNFSETFPELTELYK